MGNKIDTRAIVWVRLFDSEIIIVLPQIRSVVTLISVEEEEEVEHEFSYLLLCHIVAACPATGN